MSNRINCTKCGTPNELSAMFCRNCGVKMDFSGIQSEAFEKGRRKGQTWGVGKKIFSLINLLVFLALVAALGLMCWPSQPPAEVGSDELGDEAKAKLVRLHDACENNIQMQAMLNEHEINAYLALVLRGHYEAAGTPRINVEDLNFLISKSGVKVFTKMKMGPASITYLVEGLPTVGADGFGFNVTKVTAGHLPMPGPLGGFVANKVANVFSKMEPERFVLDHLAELILAERRAQVSTRGS